MVASIVFCVLYLYSGEKSINHTSIGFECTNNDDKIFFHSVYSPIQFFDHIFEKQFLTLLNVYLETLVSLSLLLNHFYHEMNILSFSPFRLLSEISFLIFIQLQITKKCA